MRGGRRKISCRPQRAPDTHTPLTYLVESIIDVRSAIRGMSLACTLFSQPTAVCFTHARGCALPEQTKAALLRAACMLRVLTSRGRGETRCAWKKARRRRRGEPKLIETSAKSVLQSSTGQMSGAPSFFENGTRKDGRGLALSGACSPSGGRTGRRRGPGAVARAVTGDETDAGGESIDEWREQRQVSRLLSAGFHDLASFVFPSHMTCRTCDMLNSGRRSLLVSSSSMMHPFVLSPRPCLRRWCARCRAHGS